MVKYVIFEFGTLDPDCLCALILFFFSTIFMDQHLILHGSSQMHAPQIEKH